MRLSVRSLPVVLSVLALTGLAEATVHRVDWTGGGDYLTIQEGVDAAADSDTVLVAPGLYSGAGNTDVSFGGTSIILRSVAGRESTFIKMGSASALRLTSGEDTTSVFAGFTCFRNGFGPDGVYLGGAGLTITDCRFEQDGVAVEGGTAIVRRTDFVDCEMRTFGGGMACHNSTVLIEDSLFDLCSNASMMSGFGEAIYFTGCEAVIRRTRFQNCYGLNGFTNGTVYATNSSLSLFDATFWYNDPTDALEVHDGDLYASNVTMVSNGTAIRAFTESAVVENSIIAFNRQCFRGDLSAEIRRSCIYGNTSGDSLSCLHSENLFVDPLFCHTSAGDLTLHDDSPCLPAGNPWGVVMGAHGAGGCGTGVEELPANDQLFWLLHPTPTPSRGPVTLRYIAPAIGPAVRLTVFDLKGRLVKELSSHPGSSGGGSCVWDGRDQQGHRVGSGVYFVEGAYGADVEHRTLVILK